MISASTAQTQSVRLIYRSLAAASITSDDLMNIIATAEAKNQRLGISGMLVLSQGCFLQVLEGPSDAVNQRFQVICGDRRHTDVELILFQPMTTPRFKDWAMAGVNLDDLDAELVALMKRKYGKNRSGVRIHQDPVLAESLLLDASALSRTQTPA